MNHFFKCLNNIIYALYIFSEQIYYAGPVNNPEFTIPQVRYYLLLVLNSLFLEEEEG